MVSELKNQHKNSTETISITLEKFLHRLLTKLAPTKQDMKKTDRIHIGDRYPEYVEETEEEKQKAAQKTPPDVKTILKGGYDSELLEKWKSFLAFFRQIFKK